MQTDSCTAQFEESLLPQWRKQFVDNTAFQQPLKPTLSRRALRQSAQRDYIRCLKLAPTQLTKRLTKAVCDRQISSLQYKSHRSAIKPATQLQAVSVSDQLYGSESGPRRDKPLANLTKELDIAATLGLAPLRGRTTKASSLGSWP